MDRAAVFQDPAQVAGWIVHPQEPLESVAVQIDGQLLGEDALRTRPDVAATFSSVEHALLSGFAVSGRPHFEPAEFLRITIIGRSARDEVDAVRELTVATRCPAFTTHPSPRLLERISGSTDLSGFYTLGIQLSSDVYRATEPRLRHIANPEILDWGCGCGRLALQLRRQWPTAKVHACDLDREAVDWCARNVADVDAFACDPEPPLRLSADSVDLVIGSSVMTHLGRSNQEVWLDEVHRVLRPGGIAALSTHGDFAASFFGSTFSEKVATEGLVDVDPEDSLEDALPPGYYRSVFQSRAYTIAAFTTKLRLCDYLVAGLGGYQDLVVLQKSAVGD
jgi:SAM-dependent methyltransferase